MPSTLYSTICSIGQVVYRLRIHVGHPIPEENRKASPTFDLEINDSDQFTSVDIPTKCIDPTLTQIAFERIDEHRKPSATNNSIPQTIPLHYLLNVKQLAESSIKKKKNSNNNSDSSSVQSSTLTNSASTTPIRESLPGTPLSVTSTESTHILMKRRQFSIRRFFSTPSNPPCATNNLPKTIIRIHYVDVSNLIQWSSRSLDLKLDDEHIANELYTNLRLCLSTLKQRPQRLLAFVNPLSGKGQARAVFDKKVLPIFEEANVSIHPIYTESAGHAKNLIINEPLSDYDGLVCVGGDGMFSELCHGLLLRTLQDENKDIDDRNIHLSRPKLRIGIIPAGSTDAVVFGTTGLNDPITSALQIIVGESLSIDITTVHNENGFVRFMATMLAYGFFGDIIQQSDHWRCLGPLRYDLAGFLQFLRNKSYNTELTITLSHNESLRNVDTQTISSIVSTESGSTNGSAIESEFTEQTPLLSSPFCSRHCETCAGDNRHNADRFHSPMQIKREGRYVTVNCLNMPCRCAKSKYGMSPFVHLGDGTFDLLLVKRSWRTGFLRFLWQVANDSRTIEDLPNVERYRVSEVLIRPIPVAGKRLASWACDGELINGNEIQVRVHRQALNLFASGIQFKKINLENLKPKSKSWFPCFRKEKRDSVMNE